MDFLYREGHNARTKAEEYMMAQRRLGFVNNMFWIQYKVRSVFELPSDPDPSIELQMTVLEVHLLSFLFSHSLCSRNWNECCKKSLVKVNNMQLK
jgi:hypothetical protein